jgi:hypothetical protein
MIGKFRHSLFALTGKNPVCLTTSYYSALLSSNTGFYCGVEEILEKDI